MKKQYILLKALLLLACQAISAGGTVTVDGFTPTTPGIGPSPSNQPADNDTFRYFEVYLPEGYNTPGNTQTYPVVYFLHGFGQNHTSYGGMFLALDALISGGQLAPMIVVKPDGSLSNGYLGSFFVNSSVNGDWEDYIVTELRNYVNANYRTKTDVASTAIAGHSMGAYAAYLLTIKHPGIYSSVVAHTPSTIISMAPQVFDPNFYNAVQAEIPATGPSAGKILPTNGQQTYMLFAYSAALSPNPADPFLVNLPIEINADHTPVITLGKLTPNNAVLNQWLLNDPYTLVNNSVTVQNQLKTQYLYTDYGTQEALISTTGVELFISLLNTLTIPNTSKTYPGTSFPQPGLYSPSNDVPLSQVFPEIVYTAQFLEPNTALQPGLEASFIPQALNIEQSYFDSITISTFQPFLNYCGVTDTTVATLLNDPAFINCLNANSINSDEWLNAFFTVPGYINIDPIFFSIDTDGFIPSPTNVLTQTLINKYCHLLFHSF